MKITIKGKEYGLHWGLGAFESAGEVYDMDCNTLFLEAIAREYEYNEDGGIKSIGKEIGIHKEAVLGAVINWCDENDVKFDFTVKNFTNAFNDFTPELRKEILEDFKKSIYNGRIVEEIYNEIISQYNTSTETKEVKKKARTTKK